MSSPHPLSISNADPEIAVTVFEKVLDVVSMEVKQTRTTMWRLVCPNVDLEYTTQNSVAFLAVQKFATLHFFGIIATHSTLQVHPFS